MNENGYEIYHNVYFILMYRKSFLLFSSFQDFLSQTFVKSQTFTSAYIHALKVQNFQSLQNMLFFSPHI